MPDPHVSPRCPSPTLLPNLHLVPRGFVRLCCIRTPPCGPGPFMPGGGAPSLQPSAASGTDEGWWSSVKRRGQTLWPLDLGWDLPQGRLRAPAPWKVSIIACSLFPSRNEIGVGEEEDARSAWVERLVLGSWVLQGVLGAGQRVAAAVSAEWQVLDLRSGAGSKPWVPQRGAPQGGGSCVFLLQPPSRGSHRGP